MLAKETYTLHDFHEKVIKGLRDQSSTKTLLYGDEGEAKALEAQNKICSALSEEEKNGEVFLSKADKMEIAEVT